MSERRRPPARLAAEAAAILCLLVGACTASWGPTADRQGGIGGTGVSDREGGIGGTGIAEREGGIGGTGIYGIVTGFGSIIVGGIEIDYEPAMPIDIDGRPATAAELAIGQLVEVVAEARDGGLEARSISVSHAVVGPVGAPAGTSGRFRVMGETVEVTGETQFANFAVPAAAPDGLRTGNIVAVSGHRRPDGVIVASRIAGAEAGAAHIVAGPLFRAADGTPTVGGTPLSLLEAPSSRGDYVRVRGRWDGARLQVEESVRAGIRPFGGRVARLELEGYVRGSRPDGALLVGPFAIERDGLPSVERPVMGDFIRSRARLSLNGRIVPEILRVIDRPPALRPEGETSGPGEGAERRRERIEERDAGIRETVRDRLEGLDEAGRPDETRRPERPAPGEFIERIEKIERPEAIERIERVERPDRTDPRIRIERPERPGRPKD